MTLTMGSLCIGYGGLEMGLVLAGWDLELAWVADNDPGAARVLAHRHPDVPNLGDIAVIDWSAVPAVDVVAAGFPCTDISCAGRRAGMGVDTRSGVWAHVVQAVAMLRPRLVVIENVAALLSTRANRSPDASDGDVEPGPAGMGDGPDRPVLRAIGAVLGDLATLGFDAEWVSVPASGVGSCHRRNRVFVLAWPADTSRIGHGNPWQEGGQRVSAAAVRGAVRPAGRVDLLPTPTARLADKRGMPSVDTATVRMYDEGRRNLEDAVALLPTPRTNDGRGPGVHGVGGPDLRTAVALLPTPRARDHKGRDPNLKGVDLNEAIALLPTPRATDGTNGGPNQRGSSGDPMLPSAVMLLPTATATPYGNNQSPSAGAVVRPSLDRLAAMGRWGQYAPAIARWEQVLGRPAPDPTEVSPTYLKNLRRRLAREDPRPAGMRGSLRPVHRLSPRFVEWMQGVPDGWVTAVPGVSRNDALRLLSNGVIPLQCAAAFRALVGRMDGGDQP